MAQSALLGWDVSAPKVVKDSKFTSIVNNPVEEKKVSKTVSNKKPADSWDMAPVKTTGHNGVYKSCHEDHPALKFTVDGVEYSIYGGSCIKPVINDMDVFIGLDHGMSRTSRQYPWHPGVEVYYPINDMQVPKDVTEFKKFINWMALEVLAGKKVFAGCIGGHGRTGLVFSALIKTMTGMEDSITYVRENYCKKVVESNLQVDWLHEHFGIKKVLATKGGGVQYYTGSTSSYFDQTSNHVPVGKNHSGRHIQHMKSPSSVHGENKRISVS